MGPRIVVVGAGFAGLTAARGLLRRLGDAAEVTVIDTKDHFLYLPLLPEVTTGVVEPRHIAVSLARALPGAKLVVATVDTIDVDGRVVHWTDADGDKGETAYDRLVLTVGSVNRLLPIPGVCDHAHGYRGIAEALYLRDHLVRQVELAAAEPADRAARCTFVVVGAGYTGTEVAAQGARFTAQLAKAYPALARPADALDAAGHRAAGAAGAAPEAVAHGRPGAAGAGRRGAHRRVRGRGRAPSRCGSPAARTCRCARSSGAWGCGPTRSSTTSASRPSAGGSCVDPYLAVPDHPEILACGDAAAVPDLTRPGQITAMTAQHATRQGALAARNVAAALGRGKRRRYKHHDLGFVVELGGLDAAASPLGVPLSGLAATAVTKGYHLLAMPGNRVRVAADWLLDTLLPTQAVQLGLVRGKQVPLDPERA